MDLPNIETYIRPDNIQNITNWGEGWAWLAGGTWLFSEPQPHLKALVDMQPLGWSEIEVKGNNLVIGATCPLIKLQEYKWEKEWTATSGFKSAISTLAASIKVINLATVGGNLCLALSVGTLAPLMVALGATYEIWHVSGNSRYVTAHEFQTGFRQTILQPQEVLRRVLIPLENLAWQVNYQRFGIAATDPALAIVVGAYNSLSKQLRLVISASVPAPYLLDLDNIKTVTETSLPDINYIDNLKASAVYRQQITQVLIQRCLANLLCQNR